jgi:hypothetical protein
MCPRQPGAGHRVTLTASHDSLPEPLDIHAMVGAYLELDIPRRTRFLQEHGYQE